MKESFNRMRFNEKLQGLVHNKWSRFGFVSVASLTLIGATAVGVHASFTSAKQPVRHIAKAQPSQDKVKASSHIEQSSSANVTSTIVTATSSSQVVSEPVAESTSAPEPATTDVSQVAPTPVAEPEPVTTPVAEPTPVTTPVAEPEPAPAPAPVVDTSGFNMLGQHFPIGSFAGTGQVPADGMVYRWASDARWFLIEQAGQAGQIVQNVGMGAPITVDGRTYHVTDIQHGLTNNGVAGAYYVSHIDQHAIGFQTCDAYGVLSLWFAD